MKVVILAGGYGSRLGDVTNLIPKPMVEIGDKPMLWHIMKTYAHYGFNEFIICLGYKANVIKDYFLNFDTNNYDFTVETGTGNIQFHEKVDKDEWKVTLINTGLDTLKGARLKKIEPYLEDEVNLLTYGDGVANIAINELVDFHLSNNKVVTISGVHPPARFGELKAEGNVVTSFKEKSQVSQGMINGGYMVFNKELLKYLTTKDDCDLEYGIFEQLAEEEKIAVYRHEGEWACMDNGRDVHALNKLWQEGKAFWKVWN